MNEQELDNLTTQKSIMTDEERTSEQEFGFTQSAPKWVNCTASLKDCQVLSMEQDMERLKIMARVDYSSKNAYKL